MDVRRKGLLGVGWGMVGLVAVGVLVGLETSVRGQGPAAAVAREDLDLPALPDAAEPASEPPGMRLETAEIETAKLIVAELQEQVSVASAKLDPSAMERKRRLGALLPGEFEADWQDIKAELIDAARDMPAAPWVGIKGRLQRYSASQDRDFNVPAVQGHLDLPSGPGPLWPLLAALQWLHVGKSSNIGLGWLQVTAITDDDGTAA